jgi:NADH-quinone oxidoreductase subunit E
VTETTTTPLDVASPEEVSEIRFDKKMESEIKKILARYPDKTAALLPVLWLCQDRWGWISPGVMRAIGDRLDLSPAYIEGVISFYTMFQLQPPGRFLLQVCTTLSCQLCGTADLVDHLKEKLGIDFGETTSDGAFTLVDVQCLGACGEAPVIQINDDYYSDLTVDRLDGILDQLADL